MELIALFITIFIGFALYLFYFIQQRLNYWKVRNVPYIEPEFFYGNSRGVGKTIFSGQFFKDMYLKLKNRGPFVGVYMYTEPKSIVTDLELLKIILIKEFNIFPNRGLYYNKKDDPCSAHLGNIEDEYWKMLRNKLTPTFSSGKIKNMFPVIREIDDKLIERIKIDSKLKDSIEAKNIFSRYTTDVIARIAFGIECNSINDETNEFYKMGFKGFTNTNFMKRTFTTAYPELARKMHITVSVPEVASFYKNIVEQTIKHRNDNNIQGDDFMALMKNMMKDNILSFNEVWAQSAVFILAGYETSSTTLTYCLYEMSQNKEIRNKARESVNTILKKYNGEFTYEAVNEMQYIEQCINETLRKYPPTTFTKRVAKEDFPIPNSKIVIEKGTQIFVPIWGIHLDPEIYPEPDKFDPDRFSPEEMAKRHTMSFLPFGEGPRVCIAQRFAMIEIKLTIAKLLTNFEFELDYSKTPVPMSYVIQSFLLAPDTGIFVKFKEI